jgi:hypothetical protein
MDAAGEGREQPDAASAPVTRIRVTQAANTELREMRAAEPGMARAVEDAIGRIPHDEGVPIRIDVHGAPGSREYRAILPTQREAPAVIYRRLEPADGAGGGWLVTTLIDRDQLRSYQQAELTGILDNPVVSETAASVAGTLSPIVVGQGGGLSGTQAGSGT